MFFAPHSSRILRLAVAFSLAILGGRVLRATDPDASQVEFFEKRIRPLFANHCYECHGGDPDKIKGELRLNTHAGLQKGGVSGPVIVPGNPAESRLFQAVQGKAHDLERMPSQKAGKDPLTPAEIAALEEWIRLGAPDPRTDGPALGSRDSSRHWAFQKPVAPALPAVRNAAWPRRELDWFVLAQLESKGLTPAPEADRRTLLRRITHDLTGLPPTPEEAQEFLSDPGADAYERAVDRLLNSPRYGERWGRHWLDVARYADSKGYVFEEERRYAYAYTYRDWVVAALNRDLPYDRFLTEQIAGDQLATPDNPWPMAAQGFLTLGRRFLNHEPDIIDDRLDVVFRGTQALTVGCARCHDHKYDPIPTADYYSLYGVFASSHEPGEKPLLGPNPDPRRAAEYAVEKAKREQELTDFRTTRTAEMVKLLRQRVGDYLLCAQDSLGLDWTNLEGTARVRSLDPGLVGAWKTRLEKWRGSTNPVFAPWFALAALGTNDFTARSSAWLDSLAAHPDPAHPPHPLILQSLTAHPLNNFAEVATRYGETLRHADQAWQDALAAAKTAGQPEPAALPDAPLESLRGILYSDDSPVREAMRDIDRFFDTPTAQKLRALRRKVEELDATHPGAPLRAMALLDKPQPVEPVVFKRGNPGSHGTNVPRQFLGLLSGSDRKPFQTGSGRLELARAIVGRDNPLTARVFVNRVWLLHFGTPLVKTPSDFGVRSEPPINPGLLDHLAVNFMDHGWSMKHLHRELLLSATYRQASDPGDAPAARAVFARNESTDPGNTLYWRMNRKRFDFEALRDSVLFVSGHLDQTFGGQPVEMFEATQSPRRTLYGYIDRQNLPGVLRSFDFASPDTTSSLRFQTTVPQQALFLMNNSFVNDQARHLIRRHDVPGSGSVEARVRRLYELAFQRDPNPAEVELATRFIAAQTGVKPEPRPAATWTYGYGQFDAALQRTATFHPFAVYKDKDGRWQPDAAFPAGDDRAYASLGARNGHPGRTATNAVIRRWTAPIAATVVIEGELDHPGKEGDGVRGRVVGSRAGLVGEWIAKTGKKATHVASVSVKPGDTLDFIVDAIESDNTDSFNWAPVIRTISIAGAPDSAPSRSWESVRDFRGPNADPAPIDAWEKYAQVLLSANEFVFVD